MKKLFTSESVTIGHPDKVADLIADAILTSYLQEDENSRVACEVSLASDLVLIFGEITSQANIDIEKIVRKTICDIGYNDDKLLFNGNNCNIEIHLNKQSEDIAIGVNNSADEKEIGAGDQGMMFGYASNETESYMPAPIYYASLLANNLTKLRQENILNYLRPDGKTQVTIEYENEKVKRIDTIVISTQHDENVSLEQIKNDLTKKLIYETIPNNLIDENTKILINPTGRFVIGGPVGDSGLTGRKIIVDTYGGMCRHGGGALSGKDYTKVDRSANYYARYVAKNIVAANIADKCEIQVAYAIGISNPVSINVNTFGTGKISEDEILTIINKHFNFRPNNIIKTLNLKNIDYTKTTNFSHFGKNEIDTPWERLDMVDTLKKYI